MVYEEFVASFEDSQKMSKTWIKGGVVNPAEKTSMCCQFKYKIEIP